MLKAPKFWWKDKSLYIYFFYIFSLIYEFFANKKFKREARFSLPHPVLCVGNFTLGGSGKTPLARKIALDAKEVGLRPVIIMRGYKGTLKGPLLVDAKLHKAAQVGDEAILLAQSCSVIVARERFLATSLISEYGFNFIILDDGFQSRKLRYDYSILAIDPNRNFGNKQVFPSGPLRAGLNIQLSNSDAIIFIEQAISKPIDLPNFKGKSYIARAKPIICKFPLGCSNVKGLKAYVFCAIGNAQKFYNSVNELGIELVKKIEFADHYSLKKTELKHIMDVAKTYDLTLVTTAKDYVKLDPIANICVIDVDIEFDTQQLIKDTLKAYKRRLQ